MLDQIAWNVSKNLPDEYSSYLIKSRNWSALNGLLLLQPHRNSLIAAENRTSVKNEGKVGNRFDPEHPSASTCSPSQSFG